MLLTIGIPSYNRPTQLKRALMSIDSSRSDLYNVLVIDDCSPNQHQVADLFSSSFSDYTFVPLQKNIGYDCNLKLIHQSCMTPYLIYLSDDDSLVPGSLDRILDYLLDNDVSGVSIFPCFDSSTRRVVRQRSYLSNNLTTNQLIYDSILFSGLLFNVKNSSRFLLPDPSNLIYSQLYLSVLTALSFGVFYPDIPSIFVHADGPNGFGTNSSTDDISLSDRSSLFNLLSYHKKLFHVISLISLAERNPDITCNFLKEYYKRSILLIFHASISLSFSEYENFYANFSKNIKTRPPLYLFYTYLCLSPLTFLPQAVKKIFFKILPNVRYLVRRIRGGD